MNYDFFAHAYRRYRPDYATFHTNHAAHYMHHYWRSYDDSKFLTQAPPDEKKHYGGAVEYGYELADELLGRFLRTRRADTVVVVASSMGQQPFVKDNFPKGSYIVRFKDVRRVLDLWAPGRDRDRSHDEPAGEREDPRRGRAERVPSSCRGCGAQTGGGARPRQSTSRRWATS